MKINLLDELFENINDSSTIIISNIRDIYHETSIEESNDSTLLLKEKILRILAFQNFDNRLVEAALDIVDQPAAVFTIRGSDPHHKVWKLIGSKGNPYICLKRHCPCRNYFELNKQSKEIILCKHLLAIRIANVLKLYEELIIDDDEFIRYRSSVPTLIN